MSLIDQLVDQVWDLQHQLRGSVQLPDQRAQLTSQLEAARRALYFERLKERQTKD
jgi:hypothetical protein